MSTPHLLCMPTGAVTPAIVAKLKSRRSHGRCTSASEVRLKLPGGVISFGIAPDTGALVVGRSVYIWWGASGFVCAPVQDVDAEELQRGNVALKVQQAREALAQARRERPARLAAERAHSVDLNLG